MIPFNEKSPDVYSGPITAQHINSVEVRDGVELGDRDGEAVVGAAMEPELVGKALGLPGETVGDPLVEMPSLAGSPLVGAILVLPGVTVGIAVRAAGIGPELAVKTLGSADGMFLWIMVGNNDASHA